MNGREWLGRRMDEAGVGYQRYENSFPWIGDFSKAQRLMDRMHAIRWPKVLDRVARRLNPAHRAMFRGLELSYYWSAYQTEWATDITFESSRTLAAIYPQLVRGAIASFASRDVMRFLGKRPDRRYQGEVVNYRASQSANFVYLRSTRASAYWSRRPMRLGGIIGLTGTRVDYGVREPWKKSLQWTGFWQ